MIRALRRRCVEPEVPSPGDRVGPPDFVGVGAQRSGTQWWYGLVTDHPVVRPVTARARRLRPGERADLVSAVPTSAEAPERRELHFFDSFCEAPFEDANTRLYHRFFPRAAGQIAGEWTPRYMADFWTPPLLRRAAPEAKLLVLLREPVERYLSALSRDAPMARSHGVPLAWLGVNEAVHRGRYASQLANLLEHFPRERVLVLQYERCCSAPGEELRRTYEFLGVDAAHMPAKLTAQAGPRRPKPRLAPEAERELVAALAPEVRALAERFSAIDLDLWPRFRDAA